MARGYMDEFERQRRYEMEMMHREMEARPRYELESMKYLHPMHVIDPALMPTCAPCDPAPTPSYLNPKLLLTKGL